MWTLEEKFHISTRPSIILYLQENLEGSVEYQMAHTIPFRAFQKFWCIGTINVLILSFFGFPVETTKLFTLHSFY